MKKLEDINSEYISLRRIKSYIRNLEVPAEAKVILTELLKITVKVGVHLYRIGRKIAEIAIVLATKFPAITFALIVTSFINLFDSRYSPAWPRSCSHCRTTRNCHRSGDRSLQGHCES